MDPQLAEYRRKQRERAAEAKQSAAASAAGMKQWLALAGVVLVAAAAAAMRSQSSAPPTGSSAPPTATCPKPTGAGLCVEECASHDDCRAQGKLCCSNGCGHVCMAPAAPGQDAQDSKCTLMVTLVSQDSAAAVLRAVPSPSTQKHLQGVGIMILGYAAGQSSDCCAAERALRALPEAAKSVEYDGPKPACAAEAGAAGGASAKESGPVLGGWSGSANEIDQESLDVWEKVLAKSPVHENHDLKALGKPVSVMTQVVAGVNYRFTFRNGGAVTVFHQPWTETLEVSAFKL